jgi:hypothetical protein
VRIRRKGRRGMKKEEGRKRRGSEGFGVEGGE